jgi:membrane protein DedA with SNARE-associated domain
VDAVLYILYVSTPEDLIGQVSPALAYTLLFFLIGLESAGLPVPGEASLVTAATVSAHGHLDIAAVIPVAAAGAIAGDNAGYWIGRSGGRRLLERGEGRFARRRRELLRRSEPFFERHGGKTVFLGRWVSILRILAALLAGASGMAWRRFLLWNALGGIVWAGAVGTVGYALGRTASNAIETLGAVGLLLLLLGAVGHIAWHRLQSSNP